MEHSPTIGKIAEALAKAQGALTAAAKDTKGNYGKYADLASVWEAARKPLSENGLAVVQGPGETVDKAIIMTTMLCHASGEWFRQTLTIPMKSIDAQAYGSAVTYARRYALAAMVGIAPDEDDGQAAAAIGGENGVRRTQAQKAGRVPDGFDASEAARSIDEDIRRAKDRDDLQRRWAGSKGALDRIKRAEPDIYKALVKNCTALLEAFEAQSNPQKSDILDDEVPF